MANPVGTKTFNGREYTPTTFEQYSSTLHETVNNFYTHEMNDPGVTQEEAISSTAQMSENYINAVNDYNADMQAENNAEISMDDDGGIE